MAIRIVLYNFFSIEKLVHQIDTRLIVNREKKLYILLVKKKAFSQCSSGMIKKIRMINKKGLENIK